VLQSSGAERFSQAESRLPEDTPGSDAVEPFISYAENLEDVILWRALKHVSGGFYVDIGPGNPSEGSVTRSLYERGWRGINVEPKDSNFKQLHLERPLDLNLPLSVRGQAGVVELYLPDNTRPEHHTSANQPQPQGRASGKIATPVTTLGKICEEHVTRAIHLLRINAEGSTSEILGTMDFARFRPWIVMILGSQSSSQCEETLQTAGYRFVYNDGLNHFYAASERHAELASQFATPPNVFDRFIRAREWQAERELEKLRTEKLDVEQSLFESERYIGFLAAQRQNLLDEQVELQQKNKKLKAMAARPLARVMNAARRLMRRLLRV
jgi:hypothetical protein